MFTDLQYGTTNSKLTFLIESLYSKKTMFGFEQMPVVILLFNF